MNVLIVDTSSWISFLKGQGNEDLESALEEGRVYLPPIVIAELLSGKTKSAKKSQLRELLHELPLCDSDFNHWVRVGDLRSELQSKGLTISTPDAHVAQCALDLNGYLVSEDSIFPKISKHFPLKILYT